MMISTFFGKLNSPDYFLLWLLMKFKTLNMQKDKILGASACSLLKTFWIFLHANVYVCLFSFLYTKLCPLKMEI